MWQWHTSLVVASAVVWLLFARWRFCYENVVSVEIIIWNTEIGFTWTVNPYRMQYHGAKNIFTLWHCLVSAWIADRGKFHYYIITAAYYILWKRVSWHWIRWTKLPSLVITQNRDLWRNLYRSLPYFVVRVRCGKESSRSLSHLLMSFLLKYATTKRAINNAIFNYLFSKQ